MSNNHSNTFLMHGGRVQTCDFRTPPQEAIFVRDGKVAAVGTLADLEKVAKPNIDRIDVEGATILPGFIDTHPHSMHFAALTIAAVDLSDAQSHDDIIARIRARAASTPPGEWIFCTPVGEAHYYIRRSYRDLPEGTLPNRWQLDQATDKHPVFIQAYAPKQPNMVAFNSLALGQLGISEVLPRRVCDVWIDRDSEDRVTGILRGAVTNYYTRDPLWLQILSKLPPPPPALWPVAAQAGMAEMNSIGVTSIFEIHAMTPDQLAAYQALRRDGKLTCRVLAGLDVADQAFNVHFQPSDTQIRDLIDFMRASTTLTDDWLRIEGVLLCRTGPCNPGFLRMYEPIKAPFGGETYGLEFLPRRVEETVVRYCAETGVRLSALLATPPDFDDFFSTINKLGVQEAVALKRWIVQHAILVNENSARNMSKYGMCCTTSKGFHWGKGDLYCERIGEHALNDLVPLRRLLDHGIKVGGGTDWGPKSVLEQIQLAETCELAGSGRKNLHRTQPISRAEAIGMFTKDAAEVLGWDGIGSIKVDSHADFAIMDEDPFEVPVDNLPKIQVLRTIVGGQTVFAAGKTR
ncbi:amidohydrolase [Bradyrhizobium tropiciagri]|uniref:amidohydrolase n=1 Tax=Bradyrhizobium tropiciagri TaxID=312253 RepID=UPI000B09330B|nr:amidohydrolase family protein [Bradyrhizobium tropiciagri]